MAEAYVTMEQATHYFAGVLHADAWDEAYEIKRQKALVTATRRIDALNLRGSKASSSQRLQFPRRGQQEVPQTVCDATCEEALALLAMTDQDRQRLAWQQQGVRSVSIGDASESYAADRAEWNALERALTSPVARQLISPFVVGEYGHKAVPIT